MKAAFNLRTEPNSFLYNRLSVKIINKQSIVEIEKGFIWVKLRTTAWKAASQIMLRNCSREAQFISMVSYLVKTKNIEQIRDTLL